MILFKDLFFRIFMLLISTFAIPSMGFGQNIKFSYDDAGNRIKREIITIENVISIDQDIKNIFKENLLITDIDIYVKPDQKKGTINIDLKNDPLSGEYKISIYSINGYKLFDITPNKQISDIDISDIPNGVYILVVSSQSKSRAWKINYFR